MSAMISLFGKRLAALSTISLPFMARICDMSATAIPNQPNNNVSVSKHFSLQCHDGKEGKRTGLAARAQGYV